MVATVINNLECRVGIPCLANKALATLKQVQGDMYPLKIELMQKDCLVGFLTCLAKTNNRLMSFWKIRKTSVSVVFQSVQNLIVFEFNKF